MGAVQDGKKRGLVGMGCTGAYNRRGTSWGGSRWKEKGVRMDCTRIITAWAYLGGSSRWIVRGYL